MQDGCRILGSGKSGKMAKRHQHHKLPSCLGYPKHGGKDEENLTHFFRHYQEYHKEVLMEYIVGLDMIRRGWILNRIILSYSSSRSIYPYRA